MQPIPWPDDEIPPPPDMDYWACARCGHPSYRHNMDELWSWHGEKHPGVKFRCNIGRTRYDVKSGEARCLCPDFEE